MGMPALNASASALEERLIDLLGRGVDVALTDAEFTGIAVEVFEHQYRFNSPYGAFCRTRGVEPALVCDWREIPAVPTDAFKVADLTTVGSIAVEFRTSGTTAGEAQRGRTLLPDTRLYDASLLPNYRAHMLPDVDRMRMLVLGPTPAEFPHSSLGHMHGCVMEAMGAPGSGGFLHAAGADHERLAAAMELSVTEGEPVCLMGPAFALVHFLDWLMPRRQWFRLPPGSRLMDTGGYKGRSREIARDELYALYTQWFGIREDHIVNEYGMTELASQFYDPGLRRRATGGVTTSPAPVRWKSSPPWTRVTIVDPESLQPVRRGETGLIRIHDLANLWTVIAIQTDDLGREVDAGFEVLGRAPGAEPRGCSLLVEEIRATQAAG